MMYVKSFDHNTVGVALMSAKKGADLGKHHRLVDSEVENGGIWAVP